jgi:transposase-like protein
MARRTKTQIRQEEFIAQYIAHRGNVTKAAAASGINPKTYYDWRNKHPEFLEKLDAAKEDFCQLIVERLMNDALNINKVNTVAAIFLLKAFNPEQYDDAIRRVKYLNDRGMEDPESSIVNVNIVDAIDEPEPAVEH